MSLESKIEALTAAVTTLTNLMTAEAHSPVVPLAPVVPVVATTPVVAAPVVVVPEPVAPAPVVAAPAMPEPPSFIAPVPSATAVPFNDSKTLIDYVMTKYKALGAEKGAMIQNVLTGLGYDNINSVRPEHYGQLHQGIEALG